MKAISRVLRAPVTGSALTVAVCAAFGTGPAEANVIIIPVNTLLGTVNLDINGDTIPEYTFQRNGTPLGFENDLNTYGNSVVGVVNPAFPKPGTYASLLQSGELIDGSLGYVSGPNVILSGLDQFFVGPYGEFFGNSGFAGLSFHLPGESGVHFGWVEIHDPPGDLTVVRVGYESEQNTGIVTPSLVPEPGTLALLAAGATGVLAMRRRKQTA